MNILRPNRMPLSRPALSQRARASCRRRLWHPAVPSLRTRPPRCATSVGRPRALSPGGSPWWCCVDEDCEAQARSGRRES